MVDPGLAWPKKSNNKVTAAAAIQIDKNIATRVSTDLDPDGDGGGEEDQDASVRGGSGGCCEALQDHRVGGEGDQDDDGEDG